MSLPKIDLPIYYTKIPSSEKKVNFRPFSVKEEKILLTAQESKDPKQIMMAIKQILTNCLVDQDINELATFDLEYLIIQLRSKSVDNIVEFEITDPETEEKVKLSINLSDVTVKRNESHKKTIKISDEYTLFLKYPTIDSFEDIAEDSIDGSYKIMLVCLDKLASKDSVYKFSEFPQKEIDDFVESLHSDTIKEIKNFFDTMPKVRHEIKYKNSKGNEHTFVIEGTQSFFI